VCAVAGRVGCDEHAVVYACLARSRLYMMSTCAIPSCYRHGSRARRAPTQPGNRAPRTECFHSPAASMDIMVLGHSLSAISVRDGDGQRWDHDRLSIAASQWWFSATAAYSSSLISHLRSLCFIPPALSFISFISYPCFMLFLAFVLSPLCSLYHDAVLTTFFFDFSYSSSRIRAT
jgi:hypothetical protein